MPKQLTLATHADGGFETHHKATLCELILAAVDRMVP
jgi:hypothetical protein